MDPFRIKFHSNDIKGNFGPIQYDKPINIAVSDGSIILKLVVATQNITLKQNKLAKLASISYVDSNITIGAPKVEFEGDIGLAEKMIEGTIGNIFTKRTKHVVKQKILEIVPEITNKTTIEKQKEWL